MKSGSNKENRMIRKRFLTSVLLVLLAFVAITVATVAWFSIADKTRVKSMSLDIKLDSDLRMDLNAHTQFEDYVKKISFEQIAERMRSELGFDMTTTPLEPVTTSDQNIFTYENGTVVPESKGAYLTFTLHFMAETDMLVHLNREDSESGANDGTNISSGNAGLPDAMRISFTADGQTWIYDQGTADTSYELFSLKANTDKPVLIHIWMEGTDPACTDDLKAADYAIRMRFTGESK